MKKNNLIILLLCMFFSIGIQADSYAEFFVSTSQGGGAETVTVDVSVENNKGFSAFTIDIEYDREKLEAVEAKESQLLDGYFVFNPEYNGNIARAVYAGTEDCVGDGRLYSISFKVISEKESDTELKAGITYLADEDQNSVEDSISGGVIRIIPSSGNIRQNDGKAGGNTSGGTSSGRSGGSGNSGNAALPGRNAAETGAISKSDTSDDKGINNEPVSAASEESGKLSFSDMSEYGWAKNAVDFLAENRIINGISKTEFMPQNNIRRGDFVLMLMRIIGINDNAPNIFRDIDPDDYYRAAIATAYEKGYVNGKSADEFMPDSFITRQEMFTIAYRIIDGDNDADWSGYLDYKDSAGISDYAANAIGFLSANNMVHGSDGLIRPTDNTTRAETAVFVYNIYGRLYTSTE